MSNVIPNTFQTPNDYIDRAMLYLTGSELRVLLYATRHILGWEDTIESKTAPISLSMFDGGFVTKKGKVYAGCGLQRAAIVSALKGLVKYGLLEKIGRPTKKGQRWHIGEGIEWEKLEQRKRKTERPHLSKKSVSSGSSHEPVNIGAVEFYQFMRRTSSGSSHEPVAVHRMNTTKPKETQVNPDIPNGIAQSAQEQAPTPLEESPVPHFDSPGVQVEVADELVQSYLAQTQHLQPSPVANGEAHPLSSPLAGSSEVRSSKRSPKPSKKTPPKPPAPPRPKLDAALQVAIARDLMQWWPMTPYHWSRVRKASLVQNYLDQNITLEEVQMFRDWYETMHEDWERFAHPEIMPTHIDTMRADIKSGDYVPPTAKIERVEPNVTQDDDGSTDWIFRAAALVNQGGKTQ